MEVSFTTSCPHKFQDPGAILRLSDIVLSTASFPSLGLARWRGWWQIAEDAWETTAGRDVKRCTARRKHVCWCRMSRLPSLMSICFPLETHIVPAECLQLLEDILCLLVFGCSWRAVRFGRGEPFLGCLGITTNFPSFILSICETWMSQLDEKTNDHQGSVQKQPWKRMRVTGSLTSFNFYVF